jgi:dihydrofolate synthase/folylpolyglutamate synthase
MPSRTPYEKLVRRLYRTNLYNPVKLGLHNIQALLEALDSPYLRPRSPPAGPSPTPVLHIAGTNGKGSVAYKVAGALTASGLRTGLFVSPHVASFRERAQVDFEPMPEEAVVELLPRVFGTCRLRGLPCTFFELTTALALEHFREERVDMIVLETGLGGRLDSTNAVPSDVQVVTSIGLEHTRILGDTVELIAREKGGIFKEGCPALVGPDCPHGTLEEQAGEVGALYRTLEGVLPAADWEDFAKYDPAEARRKDYDSQNRDIAAAALRLLQGTPAFKASAAAAKHPLTSSSVSAGVSRRPPCRFELVPHSPASSPAILDVAHNPPAMDMLFRKLRDAYPPPRKLKVVVGMSSDKDIALAAATILARVAPEDVYLCEAAHPRAASVGQILAAAPALRAASLAGANGVHEQALRAREAAEGEGAVLVCCGSVFIMAECRRALGYDEPRDSDYIAKEAGAGIRKDMQEHFGDRELSDTDEDGDKDDREMDELAMRAVAKKHKKS